ncbi:hypothetical protein BDV96DRAFT_636140 [Lophiotrema nucula]|uniref:SMP domain-containing protein n=1 Tax=Lophiotrema nucula TaxID=690887 RepID=A0A6A5YR63_9PLEO|nr:hypothetical protein BDV96DRAFT_636140 [Lophiotrema nucula]
MAAIQRSDSALNKETNFQYLLQQVIHKLQTNPTSITVEEARRLHEHFDATDTRSAKIISAVEALAAANPDIMASSGHATPHANGKVCLLTLVKDLSATVDINPEDVTVEVLKLTQSVVSKMQKAIGHTNAPHPELEEELQHLKEEIKPKVEQGVVTKEEADHLHSLEARAHGHTEKGGLTAVAQSVAARRERTLSLSGSSTGGSPRSTTSSPESKFHEERLKVEPKIAYGTVTEEEANRLHSLENKAHGHTEKGGAAATAQNTVTLRTRKDPLEGELQEEKAKIEPKVKAGTITKEEADRLHSLEVRAHGATEKGGLTAAAQSVAAKREQTLSDSSNSSGHKKQSSVGEIQRPTGTVI